MKIKPLLILLLLAVGFGLFYWFQWRPAEIRKECAKKTAEILSSSDKTRSVDDWIKIKDMGYEFCLQKKGLK